MSTLTSWKAMIQRCTNKGDSAYSYYGGRGISYDKAWESFAQFRADMGACPPGLTLERIDNDKDYCKDNCIWASRAEQALNKGLYRSNQHGIAGVSKHSANSWKARGKEYGKDVILYQGLDFFEACCKRKSWENNRLPILRNEVRILSNLTES